MKEQKKSKKSARNVMDDNLLFMEHPTRQRNATAILARLKCIPTYVHIVVVNKDTRTTIALGNHSRFLCVCEWSIKQNEMKLNLEFGTESTS